MNQYNPTHDTPHMNKNIFENTFNGPKLGFQQNDAPIYNVTVLETDMVTHRTNMTNRFSKLDIGIKHSTYIDDDKINSPQKLNPNEDRMN